MVQAHSVLSLLSRVNTFTYSLSISSLLSSSLAALENVRKQQENTHKNTRPPPPLPWVMTTEKEGLGKSRPLPLGGAGFFSHYHILSLSIYLSFSLTSGFLLSHPFLLFYPILCHFRSLYTLSPYGTASLLLAPLYRYSDSLT